MSYGYFKKVQGYGSSSVFPDDINQDHRGYARGPERQLMSALLFDAVQNYLNFAFCDRSNPRSRFREAVDWVNKGGGDYVFSFENVCEALGLDAQFLRCGLASACLGNEADVKRTRKNF